MMDTKQLVCAVQFRFLLPLFLFVSTVIRFNLFSFVYGCLLLIEPLLQRPNAKSMSGFTGVYMIIIVIWSALAMSAQIIFQVILLSKRTTNEPYGSMLPNCSSTEDILRNIGLQRLEPNDIINILRNTVPDIAIFISSLIFLIMFKKLLPAPECEADSSPVAQKRTQLTTMRRLVGNFFVVFMLAASGIAYPSILSAVYFVLFLMVVTWLSCLRTLGARFAILRCVLLVYCGIHMILLYLYQFKFFQSSLPPQNSVTRLFGLTGIIRVDCRKPWLISFHDDIIWPMYVNPCAILMLYFVLAIETRRWVNKGVDLDIESPPSPKKSRRQRRGSSSSERQVLTAQPDNTQILVSQDSAQTSYQAISPEASGASEQIHDDIGMIDPEFRDVKTRSAISTLYNFTMRQSYVGALIIMMVWGITYHSWLTFVLLLSACIIWLLPQKRAVCLRCMPVVLTYAIALLGMTYIYNLDLNPGVLRTSTSSGYPYSQIGLVKYPYPCLQLAAQVAYTVTFWLTLRQYLRELREDRESSKAKPRDDVEMSDNGSQRMPVSRSGSVEVKNNAFIMAVGSWLWHLLCKYWILICSALFLVMAIQEAVFYRIIYMLFFLYYVLTFQICYTWWRFSIRVFWWVVIIYSMLVLCVLYTYQFEDFPQYWSNYTGLSDNILHDIGLQQYDIATLFLKLLTPTSFLIIIILQLHYFQSEFLFMSNIRSSNNADNDEDINERDDEVLSEQQSCMSNKSWIEDVYQLFTGCGKRIMDTWDRFSDVTWRLFEVHMYKVIALTSLLICVTDVCALNVILVAILCICVPVPQLHRLMSYLTLIWVSIAVMARMFFQINSIDDSFWYSNCTTVKNIPAANVTPPPFDDTIDSASYIGLEKVHQLPHYLRLYITLIVLLAFEAVVRAHQAQYYLSNPKPHRGIIFPDIKRDKADRGLIECAQYLMNYAFYKYGLQVCMAMTVITMTVRMDAYSVIYGVFLGVMLVLSRRKCFIVWPIYIIILALLLFLQYLSCLGIPAALCYEYPWVQYSHITRNLQIYLYLPNFNYSPDAQKLIVDFFQLLFVSQQWRVFYIECSTERCTQYGGGSNKDVPENESKTFSDTFLDVKDSYLDYVKTFIFVYMYWVTLIILFIAGASRISLFCMGYLIGTFFFLWLGQDLLIKPLDKLLKLWNILVGYCYGVLMFKCVLQVVGCVYIAKLSQHYCWLVQLFSILCIHAGNYDVSTDSDCNIDKDMNGMMWDAICFVCLILQMRIYKSPYFQMVVLELQVQNQLASRGAELINGRMMEQIARRKEDEESVLAGIKRKMERIKMRQERLMNRSALLESDDHYQVIRSGDYFMFEEDSDDEVDSSIGADIYLTESTDTDKKPGPLEILNTAWTVGAQEAIDKAGKKPSLKEDGDPVEDSPIVTPGKSSDATSGEAADDQQPSTSTAPPPTPSTPSTPQEHPHEDTLGVKVETNARLAWAVFGGLLNYIISVLNGMSQHQRDIAQILDQEKAIEKEKRRRLVSCSRTSDTLIALGDNEEDADNDALDIREGSDKRPPLDKMKTKEEEFHESTPKLFQLGVALWDALMSNSAMVCYFMMILNQLVSASLLSLPYSFSVFLWAMLSVPRPTKTYWVTVITYTEAIVVIKYLFQFGFFPWNAESPEKIEAQGPFSPPKIIGIEKDPHYANFDLVLLFTLFMHRSVLKRYGLWKDTEDVEEDLKKAEALSRTTTPVATPTEKNITFETLASESQEVLNSSASSTESTCKKEKSKGVIYFLWRPFKSFYTQMTNPKFNAARDIYSMMFLCDFINFLIVVFGYKSFGPSSGTGQVVTGLLSENKVPMPFLLMVLLQFILIIGDRALYLRKYIFGKFLYQIILMIVVHAWMFFILPAVNHRAFTENTVAQLWYFVKCIYFGLSAYQIRSGYPTRILGNFLTRQYNYLNLVLFKGFLAIPFLLELRCLMDWIWTDTTLALTSWLQMEDIFANIFQIKCFRNAELRYPTPRGQKRNLLVKYGLGGVVLFILIFIIWFPLLIFSLAHTVLYVPNRPVDCSVHIQLGGYEPIFVMSSQQQYIKNLTSENFKDLQKYYSNDSDASTVLNMYKEDDMNMININGSSTSLWSISPPSEEALLTDLTSNTTSVTLYFTISFTRVPKAGMTSDTVSSQFTKTLDPYDNEDRIIRDGFANMIRANETAPEPVIVNDMFPTFMRIYVSEPPVAIKELNKDENRKIKFRLAREGDELWWELEENLPKDPYSPDEEYYSWQDYLTFIVVSDRVAPPSLSFLTGYGIIGLYVSLVLVVGRFVRIFFSGISYKIMFEELPNVDKILKLCLDVYLAREAQELMLEEDLFAKLLFLYRSPETMIKWTKIKVD